jgi:hypothetical protein
MMGLVMNRPVADVPSPDTPPATVLMVYWAVAGTIRRVK